MYEFECLIHTSSKFDTLGDTQSPIADNQYNADR